MTGWNLIRKRPVLAWFYLERGKDATVLVLEAGEEDQCGFRLLWEEGRLVFKGSCFNCEEGADLRRAEASTSLGWGWREDSQLPCRKAPLCELLAQYFPFCHLRKHSPQIHPEEALSRALAGWRLDLPCSFQLRSCPQILWFFHLTGPPAQPEGAALSLGNCTARLTAPFLQSQLPWSPCSPSAAKAQCRTVDDFQREQEQPLSAFTASAHWQRWVSHYLVTAGIQCAILQDTFHAFWAAGFCVLRLFSGRLAPGIPSAFQPVKAFKFPSAEGLAETYDLFQAGNGWKCELRNPPEPSCESCRAVPGVEKNGCLKLIPKCKSEHLNQQTDFGNRCLLRPYGTKTICLCGWRWVQKPSFWYPNPKI